jgi:O-antigen ligase
MRPPLPTTVGRWAGDLPFVVFLLTTVLCLLRARDLPSVDLGPASITPADVGLAVTTVLAIPRLRERWARLPSRALLVAAAAFAAAIALSSLANGSEAIVAAGKLVALAGLTLGAVAFVDTRDRLRALLAVVVVFATVAAAWGAYEFAAGTLARQGSFVGEHDLAAIATAALAVGLARVFGRRGSPDPLALAALAAGVVGVVLGASLAGVIGVYLVAAVTLAVALRRRELRPAAVAATAAVAAAATLGTLALRQGELGFIQSWFGPPPSREGEYAGSWSQRLIFAYVGGRIFLDNPVLGTGWHGLLPPEEFAQYLPDARNRFDDQPAHYFPPENGELIPQQAYDQVLYELGLVGALLFLALAALAVRRAKGAVRSRAPDAAYVPGAWIGAVAGALAGAAFFGGSPLTALFWLTLGLVAAEPDRA